VCRVKKCASRKIIDSVRKIMIIIPNIIQCRRTSHQSVDIFIYVILFFGQIKSTDGEPEVVVCRRAALVGGADGPDGLKRYFRFGGFNVSRPCKFAARSTVPPPFHPADNPSSHRHRRRCPICPVTRRYTWNRKCTIHVITPNIIGIGQYRYTSIIIIYYKFFSKIVRIYLIYISRERESYAWPANCDDEKLYDQDSVDR